jgi:4-oxalocrotonate tautomerase
MPIIRVEMWEGRSKELKKVLVEKITNVTCETLGCPKEAVTIVIYDIPKYNWAQEGKLAGS